MATTTFSLLVGLAVASAGPPSSVPSAVGVVTSTADVRACAIAASGDVMAATGGGLVRLDAQGRAYDVRTRLDGLPGTQVDALAPAAGDDWWVGTEGGLARVRLDDAAPGGLAVVRSFEGPAVQAIVTSDDGAEVFVGTLDAGVQRLHGGRFVSLPLRAAVGAEGDAPARAYRVHDLAWYGADLWAATAAGVAHGTVADGLALAADDALRDDVSWALTAGPDALWIGALGGLWRMRDGRVARIASTDTRAIAVTDEGLEVAAMGEGLRRISPTGRDGGAIPEVGARVVGLDRRDDRRCVATPEGLWLGTRAGETIAWQQRLLGGLPSRDVSAMAWDPHEGRMWVGTFDGGVAVGRGRHFTPVAPDDIDPQVNAIALQRIDDRTIAWIGTARGLFRVDGDDVRRWSFKEGLPHHHVQALHVRPDGDVLVGTTTGMVALRDGEVVLDIHRKRPRHWAVWAIAEDDDGTLWIGTTQGLVRYPVHGAWERVSMFDGMLPDNWVTALVVDGDTLWVGTYAAGVAALHRDATGVSRPRHLGGGRINPGGLVRTPDTLWAATMGGLRRLDRASDIWTDVDDASPGHDVKAMVIAAGRRWVGSRRGIRRD